MRPSRTLARTALLLAAALTLMGTALPAPAALDGRVFPEPRDSTDFITRGPTYAPEQFEDGMLELERRHGRCLSDLAADRPELRAGKLPALLEIDPDGRKGYLATLRAYLATFGDVAAAAKSLDIHHNTFRYRLSRLQELSGLDLDDPDERLVIELQLHFLGTGWRRTAMGTPT